MYILLGANTTFNASVTETSIALQWLPSDLSATYSVQHKVSTDVSAPTEDVVPMPQDNNTNIEHEIEGLDPGQTYTVEVVRDSVSIFLDNITTSKCLPGSCIV